MRIISQNSFIDVPYEMSAISNGRNGDGTKNYIYLNFMYPDEPQGHPILATYSTEEKAIKAMKMMREAYKVHYRAFQFPGDDEV